MFNCKAGHINRGRKKHIKIFIVYMLAIAVVPLVINVVNAYALTEIQQAQKDLKRLGYYSANIDGVVGPSTRRAIIRYQNAMHLPISGVLDAVTISYLRRPSVMLFTQDFSPFHYKTDRQGEARGPIPQIVWLTCQKAGINCRIVLYDNWRMAQEAVKNGLADGMFVITWNSERAQWLHRSMAIVETAYGLFVRENDGLQFSHLLKQPSVMDGYTVGVFGPSGTSSALKKLKTALHRKRVKIVIDMATDDKPLFKKLSVSKGKYAVYSNRMVGEAITRELGLSNTRFAGMHRGLSYYVGFSKQRVPLSVVDKFNGAYLELVKQGVVHTIMTNHGISSKKVLRQPPKIEAPMRR